MKKHGNGILFAMVLLASVTFAANAQATLIDFEDGTSGTSVGSFYTAQGVEFSNAQWITNTLAGMSGSMGIRSTSGGYTFFQPDAVVITFPAGVPNVSIVGIDVGENGLRMDAYDAAVGGSLLDSDEAYGTAVGVGQYFAVETAGTLIYRVELYQIVNTAGDGILLDDLQFNFGDARIDAVPAVPVPTLSSWSLAILVLLTMTLGFVGFRRLGQ